jgi:tetratricopeptide (TPR) repeat protein
VNTRRIPGRAWLAWSLCVLATGCVEVPRAAPASARTAAQAAAQERLTGARPAPGALAGPVEPRGGPLLQGRLMEAAGRWEDAHRQYAAASAADPDDVEALRSEVRALHALGRDPEASLRMHGAVERRPDSVPLLTAAGASVLALGSASMACEYYRHALERAPAELSVRADYAWALHLDGRHETVLAVLAGVPEESLPAHVRLALGRSALAHGDTARAARNLDAWVTTAPDDIGARLDLARAQFLARQDGLVLRSLEDVLARRPDDAQAYALLGHLRARAGQHELALRCYEEAVRRGADGFELGPLVDRARDALAGGGGRDAAR